MYAAYLPQTHAQIIGKVRETFFINQINNAKEKAYYSAIGDFQVNKFTFKLGGRNKTDHQLKGKPDSFVAADDIVVGHKNIIPLYLFGFLY